MKRVNASNAAIVSVILIGLSSLAAAEATGGLQIVVQDAHYQVGSLTFDDLNALELHVREAAPRAIELTACGPGSARALKSAVHRFGHLPLRLQVLDPDAPSCSTGARTVQVVQRTGAGPYGIDDTAVEDYWRRVMP
jgi:hypothetical protein